MNLFRRFARLALPLTAAAAAIGYVAAGSSAPSVGTYPAAPSASVAPAPSMRHAPEAPDAKDRPAGAPVPENRWASVGGNPTANIDKAWLEAEGPYKGPLEGRRLVTLTFDDGPSLVYTPQVRKSLAKYGIEATFFVIGKYLEGESYSAKKARKVVQDLAHDGHLIGNHTLDHSQLTAVSFAEATRQIDHSAELIQQTVGAEPLFFRPPFGDLDSALSTHLAARHNRLVLWNVEGKDWESDDADAVFAELTRRLDFARGGIVLLHDWKYSSVVVTQRLLAWLHANRWDPKHPKRAGYEVVGLEEFLNEVEKMPQPYATRAEMNAVRVQHFQSLHPAASEPASTEPVARMPQKPKLRKVSTKR
jgi:peptidoglycan/xylan/chitin deacetylase (PgdA/CDA1 family)